MKARELTEPTLPRGERVIEARRKGRRIDTLRRGMLFSAGVLTVAGIAATAIATLSAPDAPFTGGTAEDGRVVMDAPRLEGRDSQDRPYVVRADRALQDPNDLNRLALDGISGDVPAGGDTRVTFRSDEGFYDAENQVLDILTPLQLDTSDGNSAKVQDGRIDLITGSFVSDKPVELQTENTTLTARSMRVDARQRTAIFEGDVRMVVTPDDVRPEN